MSLPPVKITGVVRQYDWGGYHYIPSLLGDTEPADQPSAEYWLGAHSSAPAIARTGDGETDLIRYQQAGAEKPLPFLMKVLDVRQMLSIQVHPSIAQAKEGYARGEAAGIPVASPERTYKDQNHKPELAYALGEFWMLHGLRTVEEIRSEFLKRPSCHSLIPLLDEGGLSVMVGAALDPDNATVREAATQLIADCAKDPAATEKSDPGFWVNRWLTANPGVDRGILMILLRNLVELQAGEAIYQPQGLIHAYLEGRNVEIMANSDNVLRAGLTSKHIDAPELLKVSLLEATDPQQFKVKVKRDPDGFRAFTTPYPDFLLRDLELSPGQERVLRSDRSQILLFFSGERISVSHPAGKLMLAQGQSCYVPAHTEVVIRNKTQRTAHCFIGS